MISAPASIAALATDGRYVSIEMITLPHFSSALIALIRGITRSNSSSSEQGTELGRVDIPPISRISGAWGEESIEEIEDKADSVLTWEGVPSENESGVALKMAIISGVSLIGNGVIVGMIGTKD
jgi:hypothetical protein